MHLCCPVLVNKAKVTTRKSHCFRTYRCAETALSHGLGNLPTPPMAHRFCWGGRNELL